MKLGKVIGHIVAGYRDHDYKRAAEGVVAARDACDAEWRRGMHDAAGILMRLANAARAPSALNDGILSVERAEAYELARDAILRDVL